MGAAVMSRYPLQPYPEPLEHEADCTCRFADAIVRATPAMPVYVCSIYGPPENNTTLTDAEKVFVAASRPGVERGLAFKGPALITGDFNKEMHEVPFWPLLRRKGWIDCALVCHQRFNDALGHTCRDKTRRSFVLANPIMAQFLSGCSIVHEQMFDSHPVLQVTFDICASVPYRSVWSLPRSMDDLKIDEDKADEQAILHCGRRCNKFHGALSERNAEEALRQFALCFEETFAEACMNEEHSHVKLPESCRKKCRNKLKKLVPVSAPVLRTGGDSDFGVPICQPSISVRRHVKQMRRIQSLLRQLGAFQRNGNEDAHSQCTHLWVRICEANGFERGFQYWILQHLGMFVPTSLPDCTYLEALYFDFQEFVLAEVAQERSKRCSYRRQQLLEDVGRGGRLIYKTVRDAMPPPLSHIGFGIEQKVCAQRWKKEGHIKLLYVPPCQLEVGYPVHFQGQTVLLEDVDEKFLYFQTRVFCRDPHNLVIVQNQNTADPKEMQKHVVDAWSELWQCPDATDDCKEQVFDFINSMSDCPSCPYKPFCPREWNDMMKGVKNRSARGACGFSMLDVKRLPSALLLWLFSLYEAVESGMQWPARLTIARVTMLSKPGEEINKPLGVRPITILSTLYRLWSRYRSLQVLKFLGQIVPPQIGGIASKLSADVLTAMVGDTVDDAHSNNNHCCGLVIDLQKCFNLVPRWPIGKLMKKLGIPPCYTDAHMAMLNNLCRHIEISGQIGDITPSTCGVPEGCAASVVCMCALTILAAHVMQSVSPTVSVSMFADNWAVITRTVHVLVAVIGILEEFVRCLGMKLSPGKSWTWGTSPELRKGLRVVRMCGTAVPVQNSAKDLGCDMAYTKKLRKKTSVTRLAKSIRVLQRVKRTKVPKHFLGRMCTALGVGIVSYGSEIVRFTNKQFHSLRCAIASTLGLYKSGANALLATSATGLTIDPQVRLLRRRIKFFRKFFKTFPDRKEGFLRRITRNVGKKSAGLAAQFHCAFLDMGWKCESGGWISHNSGLKCNWVVDSTTFVFNCIDKAWCAHVAMQMQRKGFDVKQFSVKDFVASQRGRGPQQQGLLTAYVSGKNVTNDALSHYARDDALCPFCSCVDGKDHRVFHCQGLVDLRRKHHEVVKWLKKQPKAILHFGLFPDDNEAICLRLQTFNGSFGKVLPLFDSYARVYTDGSCFCSTSWEHAVAGAAVIKVVGNYAWELVDRQVLPTPDHSPFRAESYAVLLALQHFWNVHICSDCSAVVDEIVCILEACQRGDSIVVRAHSDIWEPIAWHLSQRDIGCVSVTKVKAHVSWQQMKEGDERVHAFFNDAADKEAKKSVAADNFDVWQKFENMLLGRKKQYEMVRKFHNLVCDIHERSFQLKPRIRPEDVTPNFADLWNLQGSGKVFACPEACELEQCPYGSTFAKRVKGWWSQLQWFEGPPTSALEMYMDFCFETMTQVPVRINKVGWVLREHSVEADVTSHRLGLQNHAWIQMLKWWVQRAQAPGLQICRCNSLFQYGPTITAWGVNMRPKLLHGPRVSESLWNYIHHGGRSNRNFKRPWSPKTG